MRVALFVIALLATTLFASETRAQVQVSDQFTNVARELAKRYVASELTNVCKTKSGQDPICTQVIASLTDVFSMALDGHLDPTRVALALRGEFSKVAQATAAELAETAVEDLLAKIGAGNDPKCSPVNLAAPLAACFVARAYSGSLNSSDSCTPAHRALEALWANCGGAAGDLSKLDVTALILEVRDLMQSHHKEHPEAYGVVLFLTQLAKIIDRTDGGTFYAMARGAALAHEGAMQSLEAPDRNSAFEDDEIDAVTKAKSACPGAAAVIAKAKAWEDRREEIFFHIALSVARFSDPAPADLALIPDDIDPRCTDPKDPLALAAQQLKDDAHQFRVDSEVAAMGQRGVVPAMLVALLIDYVRSEDDTMLLQNVRDLTLQVVARLIAAVDASSAPSCSPIMGGGGGLSCKPALGGAKYKVQAAGIADDAMLVLFATRYSPQSARRTCVYQAVSALITGSFPTSPGAAQYCRLGDPFLLETLFGTYLTAVGTGAPGVYQWNSAQFSMGVVAGSASLRFTAGMAADKGFELLTQLLPRLTMSSTVQTADVRALVTAINSLSLGLTTQARRQLLLAAADALRPRLSLFLDHHVASLAGCVSSTTPTGFPCGVRVLVDAAYDPVMTYVSVPSPTDADRQQLTQTLMVKLDGLDPLGLTPLLFNIGPGATTLTRFDSLTVHMTLLDKFGLALRWGNRRQWEAGVFVGGFVDAIIRKAVGATDAQPYWLSGATIGLRQFSKTFPFGLEAYVAAANPFDVQHYGSEVGLAQGINLIIAPDIAFTSSRSNNSN